MAKKEFFTTIWCKLINETEIYLGRACGICSVWSLMIIKIVVIFLIVIIVLAMFGKAHILLPGRSKKSRCENVVNFELVTLVVVTSHKAIMLWFFSFWSITFSHLR